MSAPADTWEQPTDASSILELTPCRARRHDAAGKNSMATNRSRKQVRESRALGLVLTPKAVRYFRNFYLSTDAPAAARTPTAVRLKEKQRLRAQYGIRESRRRAFEHARPA